MEESGPRGSAGHCRANLTPRVSLTLGGSLETTGLRVATTDLDSWEGQAGGGESITVRGLECAPDSPGILHISDKRTQRAKNMRMVLSVQGAEGSIVKVWFLLHHCTPCRCHSIQTHRSICTGQLEKAGQESGAGTILTSLTLCHSPSPGVVDVPALSWQHRDQPSSGDGLG
ncbi:unnamed protein product [Rangifer tarandus platyrhynchus]|uniref:Uncharacterized protein n=1 Tax=Rangifer tarandus platyrhynchus TaxID=3082113 RepID=A0AC60A5Q5_RANTA